MINNIEKIRFLENDRRDYILSTVSVKLRKLKIDIF